MKKQIVLAGGSGFLGRELAQFFSQKYEVIILTRHPKHKGEIFWDGGHIGEWSTVLENSYALINLSGKSVDCRYTAENRKEILNSRIESTAILSKAIGLCANPPQLWLNASSATIYVHSEFQPMTEDLGIIGDDFSMNICKKWEKEFYTHDLLKTRRVALRTSIVLGRKGGAYPKMKQLAKFFMGGQQGDGRQFVSWIHIEDFCRAVQYILEHPEFVGSVNITAPNPVKNFQFMEVLRHSLNRSFGLSQSKWLLELGAQLLGTETELLLKSRNVIPDRLIEKGFKFNYPTIDSALNELAK